MTHHLVLVDGHKSLSHKIVALHLVYSQCSSKVLQFGQLVLHIPGILQSLSNTNQQTLSDSKWVCPTLTAVSN